MQISDQMFHELIGARVSSPARVAGALSERKHRAELAPDGVLFVVAADHPARGALAAGSDPLAMADRRDLLRRLATALGNPRVDGVLASADILEDLAFFGLLDDRLAIGTMNRGGLAGARWGMDDRMTAYDAAHVEELGLDGGKVLLRLDDEDPSTAATIEACARAVTELADRRLMAMIEPLAYTKDVDGMPQLDNRPESLIRAAAVASGLGASSAYTWLKVPSGERVADVMGVSTCPAVVLGGAVSSDQAAALAAWERALSHPNCRGLVIGRSLLYPAVGDVEAGVAAAAKLVDAKARTL
ncbi:MAG: aldolase [Actinomycetota bacterium]|nr:aldolase [Actinomycetota bacterium]